MRKSVESDIARTVKPTVSEESRSIKEKVAESDMLRKPKFVKNPE